MTAAIGILYVAVCINGFGDFSALSANYKADVLIKSVKRKLYTPKLVASSRPEPESTVISVSAHP